MQQLRSGSPRGPHARLALTLTVTLALVVAALPAAAQVPAADPARTIDLAFPEGTPSTDIYRALGDAFGLTVIFDRQLDVSRLGLELHGVDATQAFDTVTRAAGDFAVAVPPNGVLIASDTPQKRREHEPQVIRTFRIEHASPSTIHSLLASVIGVKHAQIDTNQQTLTVRDSAAKVALVERLVRGHDRAPGSLELVVDVLRFDRARLDRLLDERQSATAATAGATGVRAGLPLRLPSAALGALIRDGGAEVLARPTLALRGGIRGRLELGEHLPVPGGELRRVGLGLSVVATLRRAEQGAGDRADVTLAFDLDLQSLSGPQAAPIVGQRKISSEIVLAPGESYTLAGLLDIGGDTGGGTASPDLPPLVAALSGRVAEPSEIVIAITPRILALPAIHPDDRQAIPAGTEVRVGLTERPPHWVSLVIPIAQRSDPAARAALRERLERLPRGLAGANHGGG